MYYRTQSAKRKILELPVKCCHAERGCTWKGTGYNLEQHMKKCASKISHIRRIELEVSSSSVWKWLSERREWGKYLFHGMLFSEGVSDDYFANLYSDITKEIEVLCIAS